MISNWYDYDMKNLSEKFNNKGVGGKRVEIPKEDDTIYTEFELEMEKKQEKEKKKENIKETKLFPEPISFKKLIGPSFVILTLGLGDTLSGIKMV